MGPSSPRSNGATNHVMDAECLVNQLIRHESIGRPPIVRASCLSSPAEKTMAKLSSREYVFVLCVAAFPYAAGLAAQRASSVAPSASSSVFRDCAECPEMVMVPAGRYLMGSTSSEKAWATMHGATAASVSDEAPQHEVSLRSFALGRYDVTRGEYASFVRETGYPDGDGCGHDGGKWMRRPNVSWRNPGFPQSDREPVVCVSWNDAHAYVKWLNQKLQRSATVEGTRVYRLPSESEWEYAARAGSSTKFWWGDDVGAAADHAWFQTNSGGRTHEVGSKPANAFGLYDMSGNVWQWTEDCYADSYVNAPSDGSAARGEAMCLRVDRGSSWYYPAWLLRPATRERNPAGYRDIMLGFRVARE